VDGENACPYEVLSMALFGALTSVANKVKQALGIGTKPQTVIPKTRGLALYRAYGGDTEANLLSAISRKQPVTFFYDDKWQPDGTPNKIGQRVGNPHAVWVGRNGTKYLHMYVDPASASATGDLPGWRTFILSRIQNVSIMELGTKLFGKPVQFVVGPGYNARWYSQVGTPIGWI